MPYQRKRGFRLPAKTELVEQLDLFLIELLQLALVALRAAPGNELLILQHRGLQGGPLRGMLLLVILQHLVIAHPAQVLHAPLEPDAVQLGSPARIQLIGLEGATLQVAPQSQAIARRELLAGLGPTIGMLGAVILQDLEMAFPAIRKDERE